jgi:hypothetical protein
LLLVGPVVVVPVAIKTLVEVGPEVIGLTRAHQEVVLLLKRLGP